MAEVQLREQLLDLQRRKFIEDDYDYFSASYAEINGTQCLIYHRFVKEGNETELSLSYDANANNIYGVRTRTPSN